MYKYIEDGVAMTWEPLDKNLGIAIVKEVTNKTSTAEKLVEVNAVEREHILKLYAERNNDPVVEVEEEKTAEELIADVIVMGLVTQEAIATMYEENSEQNLANAEAMATIYEEILEGK